MKTQSKFIQPGDVLPNGATVIAYDHDASRVLALSAGAVQPYVVWSVTRTQDRECHSGYYFAGIGDAVEEFNS